MTFRHIHLVSLATTLSLLIVMTTATDVFASQKHRKFSVGHRCGVEWGVAVGTCQNGGSDSGPLVHSSHRNQLEPINTSIPAPPPGTLGQTFQLRSRPVPVEKHPRVGMVDVYIEGAHEVIVHDMNEISIEQTIEGFRDIYDDDLWHFESQPLYPGLEHIYRVQATFKNADGSERKEARYIRLIMGRVVELKF